MACGRAGTSFMTRLGRDQRGNILAISAAALIPLAGLIGGGVDMSRLYLTKTRLQQACDAGALAGRRAMGSGSWTDSGATSSRGRALELFNANFTDGAYGTDLLSHDFVEDDGEVTGSAVVTVPMTMMRIFGMTERTMTVTCTAKMEIPNTDVMFVLDVTGSMNCPSDGSYCPGGNNGNTPASNARIYGLKSAVKCFYEALLRVNTDEVCGGDPTATTYSGTAQIRMGFMPYSVNVNVGKLLNNAWIADNWAYQSREPNLETVYSWEAGAEGPKSPWGNWTAEPTLSEAYSYTGWSTVNGGVTINGTNYPRYRSATNSSNCTSPNFSTGGSVIGYSDSPLATTSEYQVSPPPPPVHPAEVQPITYMQEREHEATAYRYRWNSDWNNNKCRLQSGTNIHTLSRQATATRQVTWTEHARWIGWTYKQKTFDVSTLKAGGANWNGSVSLPLTTMNGPTVKLSGSNWDTTLVLPANMDVGWDGCIEERATIQNSDGNPSDEWSPIPSGALDMNIDLVPDAGTSGSHWGPMLENAVWGRYTGSNTSNRTTNDVVTTSWLNRNNSYYCSTEAKKLQTWYTPGGFETYVDSLTPIGNTYHDIGMIWGARFISPTGIFASENAQTSTGGAIQRHIIFMTDGDTMTDRTNYTSQGLPWWDRRQTTYAPSNGNLDDILNSRLVALCTAIKNRNITLWVVSYGTGTSSATQTRLQNCATPGKFFQANDTPTLISNFKQIASEIADLRLTS